MPTNRPENPAEFLLSSSIAIKKEPITLRVILRRKQVEFRTGLSRSTIYARLSLVQGDPKYDPLFPKRIKLSENGSAIGFLESDVDAWIESRIAASTKGGQ